MWWTNTEGIPLRSASSSTIPSSAATVKEINWRLKGDKIELYKIMRVGSTVRTFFPRVGIDQKVSGGKFNSYTGRKDEAQR